MKYLTIITFMVSFLILSGCTPCYDPQRGAEPDDCEVYLSCPADYKKCTKD